MKKKTKASPSPARRARQFSPERLRWLNVQLAHLAPSCPWNQRNPAECPLADVRKLPATAVAEWLENLSPEEKEYLVLYHQCCLAIKWDNASEPAKAVARR